MFTEVKVIEVIARTLLVPILVLGFAIGYIYGAFETGFVNGRQEGR